MSRWTLGMIQHLCDLGDEAKGKTGNDYISAKLSYLNFKYAWTKDEESQRRWAMVNRHIWRRWALYQYGDCFLALFPGAHPHQTLSTYGRKWPNNKRRKYNSVISRDRNMEDGKWSSF
jgi:hypothetical protein